MPPKRIKLLNDINFEWDPPTGPPNDKWIHRQQELVEYKKPMVALP